MTWRYQGVTIPFFQRDRLVCVHEHFGTNFFLIKREVAGPAWPSQIGRLARQLSTVARTCVFGTPNRIRTGVLTVKG
jgi:hypothetical protein